MTAHATSSPYLWYLSRASGLVLLALFSAVVVLGVAARTGSSPAGWPRFVFVELHRTLALFAVALLVLHVVTAILDPFVTIGWGSVVVPFLSSYRPAQIALGAIAVDLGGAVIVTSLLRVRLGFRAWRLVHWLAYLAWPAAFVHSLTAGNDLTIWWAALIEMLCAAAVLTAVLARVLLYLRGDRAPGAPNASGPPPEIPADFFDKDQQHWRVHR